MLISKEVARTKHGALHINELHMGMCFLAWNFFFAYQPGHLHVHKTFSGKRIVTLKRLVYRW